MNKTTKTIMKRYAGYVVTPFPGVYVKI